MPEAAISSGIVRDLDREETTGDGPAKPPSPFNPGRRLQSQVSAPLALTASADWDGEVGVVLASEMGIVGMVDV